MGPRRTSWNLVGPRGALPGRQAFLPAIVRHSHGLPPFGSSLIQQAFFGVLLVTRFTLYSVLLGVLSVSVWDYLRRAHVSCASASPACRYHI